MRNLLLILSLTLLATGCGKKGNAVPEPQAPKSPVKSVLAFPVQNAACTQGAIVSADESKIVFKWNSATNAESYELNIKNLLTGISLSKATSQTELEVTLSRNTPYSWYVVSKSGKVSETAQSDVWKFYNSGSGAVSYAPFPAEILSPGMGETVSATAGKISLDWNGLDVDNDITSYDVYFSAGTTPALLKSNVSESILADVSVTANTTYYWKVITKDSKGNTSDSGVYQIKVN